MQFLDDIVLLALLHHAKAPAEPDVAHDVERKPIDPVTEPQGFVLVKAKLTDESLRMALDPGLVVTKRLCVERPVPDPAALLVVQFAAGRVQRSALDVVDSAVPGSFAALGGWPMDGWHCIGVCDGELTRAYAGLSKSSTDASFTM